MTETIDLSQERGRRIEEESADALRKAGMPESVVDVLSHPDVDEFSISLRREGHGWKASGFAGPYIMEAQGSTPRIALLGMAQNIAEVIRDHPKRRPRG